MQVRSIPVLTLLLVLGGNLAVTMHADDAKSISDREACQRMKTLLPQATRYWGKGVSKFRNMPKITGTRLTPTGFVLTVDGKPAVSIAYADVQNARLLDAIDIILETQAHPQWIEFDKTTLDEVQDISAALNHLAHAARAGRPTDCTGNVMDKVELDTFSQKIAPWRAMANKPALSDEVIKKRLLAEDAIEHKNLGAAVGYYDAGVALDPTWAQGWYNAALLYAEQQDYFDAAARMNHYLILLPEAPDAVTAKEKLLLWEAKAEESNRR